VDRLVHLFAVNGHVLWGDDAEAHLIPTDLHHRDDDVVVDDDRLVFFPGQHEHWCLSFRESEPGWCSQHRPECFAPPAASPHAAAKAPDEPLPHTHRVARIALVPHHSWRGNQYPLVHPSL